MNTQAKKDDSAQQIVIGVLITVIGGLILAMIVGEGRFAPASSPAQTGVAIVYSLSGENSSNLLQIDLLTCPDAQGNYIISHFWVRGHTRLTPELALRIRDAEVPEHYSNLVYIMSGDHGYWVQDDRVGEAGILSC